MFEFFDAIASLLATMISFIVNFFSGLVTFFLMIGQSLVFLTECVGHLPPFLTVFVVAIIAMSIITHTINHGG